MNTGHACQPRHVQRPCKAYISQTLHTSFRNPVGRECRNVCHTACCICRKLLIQPVCDTSLVLAGGYQKLASCRGVSKPWPRPPLTRSWRRSWEALVKTLESIQHKNSPRKAARHPVSQAQLLVYLKTTGMDKAQQSTTSLSSPCIWASNAYLHNQVAYSPEQLPLRSCITSKLLQHACFLKTNLLHRLRVACKSLVGTHAV